MAKYRITLECVLEIEAESDEEAWDKLPEQIDLGDMFILDTKEVDET